jgi:hypothetical protein
MRRFCVVLSVVASCAAAAVLADGARESVAHPLRAAAPASTINPAVAAQLSVFRRAPRSADALPTGFRRLLQSEYASEHPDYADSRRVKASDGQTAYLVPSRAGACVVNTNEAFCVPAANIAGPNAVDLCSPTLPSGQIEIEWLLPDRATHVALAPLHGPSVWLRAGFNVYIVHLPIGGPLPATIHWHDAQGRPQQTSASIPPGAQTVRCAHPPTTPTGSSVTN